MRVAWEIDSPPPNVQSRDTKDTEDTKEEISMRPNEASKIVIGAAICIHSELGAGLLERAYDACLYYEFTRVGLRFEHQVGLPVTYQGIRLTAAYRVDFIVENCLIVEIKCVEKILPVHLAQVMTYLKLSRNTLGLLLNFNVPHMRDGIRRIINGPQNDL